MEASLHLLHVLRLVKVGLEGQLHQMVRLQIDGQLRARVHGGSEPMVWVGMGADDDVKLVEGAHAGLEGGGAEDPEQEAETARPR